MKKLLLMLWVIVIVLSSVDADVIVLKSGKKVAGVVSKKEDGYELKNEDGQLIGFALDEVERVVTKPEELTADANKLFDEAKSLYSDGLKLDDLKIRNSLYHDGLAKLGKARDIYTYARDIFPPEKTLYIDKNLQDAMQLVKLFRERLVTGEDISIVVKSNTLSKVVKEEKESEEDAKADVKKPGANVKAEVKEPIPDITSAVLILTDIKKLSDESLRIMARESAKELAFYKGKAMAKNFASALAVFLQGDLYSMDFLQDILKLKGANLDSAFSGKVTRKDKSGLTLHTNQGNVLVVLGETENAAILPNGLNIKLDDYKLDEGKESKAVELFGKYLKLVNLQNISGFGANEHITAARFLANAARDSGAGGSSGLELLACGHISSALASGANERDLKDVFNTLGFEKSFSNWGKPIWLDLHDARISLLTEDYDFGSALIDETYKDKKDFELNYISAYLKILNAISKKAGLDKVSANLKTLAKNAPNAKAREHLEALAKSIDKVAPCSKCDGTGKLKCYKCKGKKWITMQKCPACKGTGDIKIVLSSGTARFSKCKLCKGTGEDVNVPCQQCGGKLSSIQCQDCNGEGFKKRAMAYGTRVDKCETCNGTGVNPDFVKELKAGSGFVQCYKCKGKNANHPPTLEDVLSRDVCDQCDGVGFPIPKIAYPCSKCFGLGIIIAPASDPTKKLGD